MRTFWKYSSCGPTCNAADSLLWTVFDFERRAFQFLRRWVFLLTQKESHVEEIFCLQWRWPRRIVHPLDGCLYEVKYLRHSSIYNDHTFRLKFYQNTLSDKVSDNKCSFFVVPKADGGNFERLCDGYVWLIDMVTLQNVVRGGSWFLRKPWNHQHQCCPDSSFLKLSAYTHLNNTNVFKTIACRAIWMNRVKRDRKNWFLWSKFLCALEYSKENCYPPKTQHIFHFKLIVCSQKRFYDSGGVAGNIPTLNLCFSFLIQDDVSGSCTNLCPNFIWDPFDYFRPDPIMSALPLF